jgi:hypothetical protein
MVKYNGSFWCRTDADVEEAACNFVPIAAFEARRNDTFTSPHNHCIHVRVKLERFGGLAGAEPLAAELDRAPGREAV